MDTSRSSGRVAAHRSRLGLAAALFVVLVAAALASSASGASQRTMSNYDVQELGSLGGTYSAGWVAGNALVASGDLHAALWRFGSVTDLGTFGGPGTNSAVLWPVKNELGAISGIAETDDLNPLNDIWSCGWFFTQSRHNCSGFVWQDGQKRPLPTLGGYNSFATGTNDHLQTVGWAETTVHDSSCVAPQVLQFLGVIWGLRPRLRQVQREARGPLGGRRPGRNRRPGRSGVEHADGDQPQGRRRRVRQPVGGRRRCVPSARVPLHEAGEDHRPRRTG